MTPAGAGGATETPEALGPPGNGGDPWKRDRQGREYVKAEGRQGIVFRQGEETVDQARARDAEARASSSKDRRPRRRGGPAKKTPPKPPAPTKVELKELEKVIAEALRAPAMLAAAAGDEWSAEHFTKSGPYLARNLISAAEHNPWLRLKLEAIATAGELPMQLVALMSISGALVLYVVPPVIWWLNLPVPDRTRAMFDIPPRRVRKDDDAARGDNGAGPPEPHVHPEPWPED